jgi:hypothetical protein
VVLLLAAFLMQGCKGGKKTEQFALNYAQTFDVPVTIRVNVPHNTNTSPFATNIALELERNNTNISLIDRVELKQLRFLLKSPAGSDLGFIGSVNVFLRADGLPETLLAWRENIPDNNPSHLWLNPTPSDLKAYLLKERISFRISMVAQRLIASEHRIDLEASFTVSARFLGL